MPRASVFAVCLRVPYRHPPSTFSAGSQISFVIAFLPVWLAAQGLFAIGLTQKF